MGRKTQFAPKNKFNSDHSESAAQCHDRVLESILFLGDGSQKETIEYCILIVTSSIPGVHSSVFLSHQVWMGFSCECCDICIDDDSTTHQ